MQREGPRDGTGVHDLLGEDDVVDKGRLAGAAIFLRDPDAGNAQSTELGIQALGNALGGLPLGHVRNDPFHQKGSHRRPKSLLLLGAGASPHDVPPSVARALFAAPLETERIGRLG